jgi:hypothetical protein
MAMGIWDTVSFMGDIFYYAWKKTLSEKVVLKYFSGFFFVAMI